MGGPGQYSLGGCLYLFNIYMYSDGSLSLWVIILLYSCLGAVVDPPGTLLLCLLLASAACVVVPAATDPRLALMSFSTVLYTQLLSAS